MHTTQREPGLYDIPPETAEPLVPPNDLGPFNDALALLEKTNKRVAFNDRLGRMIGIPVLGITIVIALLNSSKPDHTMVKTITIYCYQSGDHLRNHDRALIDPKACDTTSVDISDLIPIQKDRIAQDAIARQLLPVIIRKAFEIANAKTSIDDVRDLVTPYLDPHSQAFQYFTTYYSQNNIAKLAQTQTTSVTVDPMQPPIQPGTYIIGYWVTASNGETSQRNHYLAQVSIRFDTPRGANTSGLYIYQFAINDSKAAEPLTQ